MNIPIPQHGGRVGAAVQSLINTLFTLLATLLGWQLDSVENIAGLATVDDTRIPDGSKKVVRSLWDSFTLDKTDTTSVVDGITVVATMSGDGRWLRDLKPTSTVWSNQATWYVDADNGSDENDGLTDSTELATFAEFRRRVESGGVLVDMTINVETDLPSDDPILLAGEGKQVTIEGTPISGYTGTVTNYVFSGVSNDAPQWDDAGLDIPANMHQHVRFTSGAADGMGCWILEDLGGVNTVRTSLPHPLSFGFGITASPGDGDTYVVETFPVVSLPSPLAYSGELRLSRLHQRDYDSFVTSISLASILYTRACKSNLSTVQFAIATDCIGSLINDGRCFVYAGAYGSLTVSYGAKLTFVQPVMLDMGIAQSAPIAIFGEVGAAGTSDIWLFGDIDDYFIEMSQSSVLDLGALRLRGSPSAAGLDRLMIMATGSRFLTTRTDHTVTEETIYIEDSGLEIELNSQTPIIDPSSGVQIGLSDSANLGAIASRSVGIKGALTTPGTVFALEDLTENATELPMLVTNRSFLRNLQVNLVTGPGAGINTVVHVYLNGVDQGAGGAGTFADVTLTGAGANVSGFNTSDSILVVPGDRVSIYVENDALSSAADLSVSWEMG